MHEPWLLVMGDHCQLGMARLSPHSLERLVGGRAGSGGLTRGERVSTEGDHGVTVAVVKVSNGCDTFFSVVFSRWMSITFHN